LSGAADVDHGLFRAGHVPVIGVNARFRATGRPVYASLEEVPVAR
jgi:hypothetical protein